MKIFKRKPKVPINELPIHICENCHHAFQGRFCPDCGQEVAEFDRPFGFMIYDFVGNFFAFDTRFLTTFKYLLTRPGYLTNEFFKGHRASYSPPFRIFVFLSFIMFMFLQMLSDKALSDSVPVMNNQTDILNVQTTEKHPVKIDSTINMVGTDTTLADSIVLSSYDGLTLNLNLSDKNSLRKELERHAILYEKELQRGMDYDKQIKTQKYITMLRAPEMVVSNVLKYLSWSFFVLLPLFALLLKLFFWRKNKNFIQHLIYSIHLHSFKFFIYSLIFGLALIFGGSLSWFYFILILLTIIYQVVALKKFYNIKYVKAIIWFSGINLLYQIMLWTAIIAALMKSISV